MDLWCFVSNGPFTPGSYSSFMFTLHVLSLIVVLQVEPAFLFWPFLKPIQIFTTQIITHLEPDILGFEVKWTLGSITTNKASGGDGIPVELFQILKDDAVKVLHSICQQICKTQQWPQDWKTSVFIPTPKKGNAKECSNYHTIALISHASKVMLKILQARLQ